MMDMMPFILEEQHARVKDEIQGKDISIIFDYKARGGVGGGCSVSPIKQRLVSVCRRV